MLHVQETIIYCPENNYISSKASWVKFHSHLLNSILNFTSHILEGEGGEIKKGEGVAKDNKFVFSSILKRYKKEYCYTISTIRYKVLKNM
jgi:hypothetical protein